MLQFRIQSTPNPRARKYILSQDIKAEGKVSYQDPLSCEHVPMANALLHIGGISQVHFFENIITITQSGMMNWKDLDEIIQNTIEETIDHHDPHFIDHPHSPTKAREDLPPQVQEVENILDATIRPSLHMDGGDVEVLEVEDRIITIRYLGACGGCPSALEGTLQAMQHVLSEGLHKDVEVVAV